MPFRGVIKQSAALWWLSQTGAWMPLPSAWVREPNCDRMAVSLPQGNGLTLGIQHGCQRPVAPYISLIKNVHRFNKLNNGRHKTRQTCERLFISRRNDRNCACTGLLWIQRGLQQQPLMQTCSFSMYLLLFRADFGLKAFNVWFRLWDSAVCNNDGHCVEPADFLFQLTALKHIYYPSSKSICFGTTLGIIKIKTDWQNMYLGGAWEEIKLNFWSLSVQFLSLYYSLVTWAVPAPLVSVTNGADPWLKSPLLIGLWAPEDHCWDVTMPWC